MEQIPKKYNLIVIGGGSGGLLTAAIAAGLGARVALIEKHKMGGDCLNYGCIPSKTLIDCAKRVHQRHQTLFGLPAQQQSAQWAEVRERIEQVIATIAVHDSVERFTELGVDVYEGSGKFLSNHQVEVSLNNQFKTILTGKSVVIATGSTPFVPPIEGLESCGYLTNETVFGMKQFPNRLLVLGAGPIGLELGQSLARLGSKVTIAELSPRILPNEDQDLSDVLTQALLADGLTLKVGHRVQKVNWSQTGKKVLLIPSQTDGGNPEELEVDEILVASGRKPSIEGLGLKTIGIKTANGRIQVNANMRTTVRNIYACGDVVGPYAFTHTAGQQARIVAQNALLPFTTKMDLRTIPWCTFTEPQVARVGKNEDDLTKANIPYRCITIPISSLDRAITDGKTAGLMKVLTPPGQDQILGAAIVGEHAGELIHELVLAMNQRLTLKQIASTVHIYPTLSEGIRRAADQAQKERLTPFWASVLRRYLRLTR